MQVQLEVIVCVLVDRRVLWPIALTIEQCDQDCFRRRG